jgi:hypothetical protein
MEQTIPVAPASESARVGMARVSAAARHWVTSANWRRAAEIVGLIVAYSALAVLLTWPLARDLRTSTISLGDPIDSIWRLGWGQHQLLHRPWALFNANVFYPYSRAYLFDELIIGVAIITLPFRLFTQNPVLIYNLAVLTTFVLSGLGMYVLARRLGAVRLAAFAAGLIYAFAPLHLAHLPHLGLLSGQYFPLIVLLLDRLFSAPRWRDAVLLAALLALQALSAQYYAFYLIFVVGGFVALRLVQDRWRGWWPTRATWGRLVVAGTLAALPVLPFLIGYRLVQNDYAVERSFDQNAYYSANLASFITADAQNWLWGYLTAPLRDFGAYTFERNMFPGLLALVLAALGICSAWRKPLAQFLILLGLGSAVLALGPNLYLTADNKSLLFTHMPYGFLYFHVPGFDSMRVPARIGILYLLSVAGLASLGLSWLLARLARLRWPRRAPALASGLALVLIAGILVESLNQPFQPAPLLVGNQIPPVYRWLARHPNTATIELPFVIPDHVRTGTLGNFYQYYSLYHHSREMNGSANVLPKGYKALYYELRDGLTPRGIAILEGLGVNYIVVHYGELDPDVAAQTRALLQGGTDQAHEDATFGDDAVYGLVPNNRFQRLRDRIPRGATIYLSREDPTGAYGGMLGRVLRDNRIYTRVRVEYGQDYAGTPQPGAQYDYGILYRDEDPAAAGFPGATVIWEDDVVRIYKSGSG